MMNETAKRNKKIKKLNTREFVEPCRKNDIVWKDFSRTVQKDCTIDTMEKAFLEWNEFKEGGEVCLNVYVPQYYNGVKTGKKFKLCGITVQSVWNDWRSCDYIKYYDIMGGKEFVPRNIISRIPVNDVAKVIRLLSRNLKKNYCNEEWRKLIAESYTSDDRKYLWKNGEFCEFATDYNYKLEDNLTTFSDFIKAAIELKWDIKKADVSMIEKLYKDHEVKITKTKKENTFKKYVNCTYEALDYLNTVDSEMVLNLYKMLGNNTNVYILLNAIVYNRMSYVYHYKTSIDKETFLKFAAKMHSLSCRYGIRYTIRKDFLCTREYNYNESYVKPGNEKK